jgi:hypothetical protein
VAALLAAALWLLRHGTAHARYLAACAALLAMAAAPALTLLLLGLRPARMLPPPGQAVTTTLTLRGPSPVFASSPSPARVIATSPEHPRARRSRHLFFVGYPIAAPFARRVLLPIPGSHVADRRARARPQQPGALRASMEDMGATVVAGPELKVSVEPYLEIARAALKAMPAKQKLLLVGVVAFKPDVPPVLVSEKLDSLQVTGVLLASEAVRGALLGRMQIE